MWLWSLWKCYCYQYTHASGIKSDVLLISMDNNVDKMVDSFLGCNMMYPRCQDLIKWTFWQMLKYFEFVADFSKNVWQFIISNKFFVAELCVDSILLAKDCDHQILHFTFQNTLEQCLHYCLVLCWHYKLPHKIFGNKILYWWNFHWTNIKIAVFWNQNFALQICCKCIMMHNFPSYLAPC